MFRSTVRPFACVALLCAVGLTARAADAEKTPPAPRVLGAVKGLGYEYEVTPAGTVIALVPIGTNKARAVFIESKTQTVGLAEKRNLMSLARVYDGPVPEDAAKMIRDVNAQLPVGEFVVVTGDGNKRMVVLVLRVDAEATAAELSAAIKAACGFASTMSVALARID